MPASEERTANVTKSSAGVVRRYLERACNRAEIPRITLHDLRHHWATTLGIAGTPPEMLRSWGGWRDLSMVERYCRAPAVEVGAGDGLREVERRASNAPAASGDDEISETARERKPA